MTTIYKRSGSYYLQWREGGKRHKLSLGPISLQDAETYLHAKEVELRTGIPMHRQIGHAFRDVATEYLAWHKFEYPDSHDRIYQITHSYLLPAFGSQTLSIDTQSVERYKRSRHAAVETVNKELRTLKAIINKAVEWGYIDKNPIKYVKPIKKIESAPPRFYTADELEKIYESDSQYRHVWQLMANTGMRRAEAIALTWANVYPDHIRIISTTRARTKSAKWRKIPLSPGAIKALESFKRDGEHVLPRVVGRSLTRAFERAVNGAGIDGSLHCLRHTFCSHLVMQGVPLRTVQKLAGHASYRTTENYAHLSSDYLQSSVDALDL